MKRMYIFILCFVLMGSVAHGATLNKVAAVVNGQMISQYDIEQATMIEAKKANLDPKKAANKGEMDAIRAKVLENLILDILVMSEAEKQGIAATPEEVDREIVRIMQRSGMNKTQFEKKIKADGVSLESLRTGISKNIVRQKLMGMMVGRKVVVTPEEVRTYYDAHQDEMIQQNETIIALLVYPDNVNAADYARQIKQDGNAFEAIAQKVSIGPNRERGGLLGEVPFGKLDPRLVKMLETLNEGEATPILMLNGKKAQFKLVKKAAKGKLMTFDEAKPHIENMLRQPLLKERFEEYVELLRKRAVIEVRM